MGERNGSGGGGGGDDPDLSPFAPLSEEDGDDAPTAADVSLDELDVDIAVGPAFEFPPTVEVDPDLATVDEPVPEQLADQPPQTDPEPGFELGVPTGPSREDDTFRIPTGANIAVARRPLGTVWKILGLAALFVVAVSLGALAKLWVGAEAEPAADDGTADGSDAPTANGGDASNSASAATADAAPADAGGGDASSDGGTASDATADAVASSDAGFVIGEIEIPAVVERMRPRVRARRARRQRRVALRLFGRMRYERAEEAWRRALVLQPNNPWTHRGLARTLRAQGRDEEAAAWGARAEESSAMRRRRRRNRRRRRRR